MTESSSSGQSRHSATFVIAIDMINYLLVVR
jgi:hypothetical protein